jgi:hypothetical protein
MEIGFEWRGADGSIAIECRVNDSPMAIGSFPGGAGFPMCTATVTFPHMGYRSMTGWVQLVRSTDNASAGTEFETDPFALFGDAPSPYCWYGLNPTLFDAPSRSDRDDLEWEAHSFLATTPLEEVMELQPRRVVPLAGFSWGFRISDQAVYISPLQQLSLDRWNRHSDVLRAKYRFWNFADV